jgi:hypothetical protein
MRNGNKTVERKFNFGKVIFKMRFFSIQFFLLILFGCMTRSKLSELNVVNTNPTNRKDVRVSLLYILPMYAEPGDYKKINFCPAGNTSQIFDSVYITFKEKKKTFGKSMIQIHCSNYRMDLS